MLYPRKVVTTSTTGGVGSGVTRGKNLSRNRFDALDAETLIAAHRLGLVKIDRVAVARAAGVSGDVVTEWTHGRSVSESADQKIRTALRFGGRAVAGKGGL